MQQSLLMQLSGGTSDGLQDSLLFGERLLNEVGEGIGTDRTLADVIASVEKQVFPFGVVADGLRRADP